MCPESACTPGNFEMTPLRLVANRSRAAHDASTDVLIKDAKDGGVAVAPKDIKGVFLFVRHARGFYQHEGIQDG